MAAPQTLKSFASLNWSAQALNDAIHQLFQGIRPAIMVSEIVIKAIRIAIHIMQAGQTRLLRAHIDNCIVLRIADKPAAAELVAVHDNVFELVLQSIVPVSWSSPVDRVLKFRSQYKHYDYPF